MENSDPLVCTVENSDPLVTIVEFIYFNNENLGLLLPSLMFAMDSIEPTHAQGSSEHNEILCRIDPSFYAKGFTVKHEPRHYIESLKFLASLSY